VLINSSLINTTTFLCHYARALALGGTKYGATKSRRAARAKRNDYRDQFT